MTLRDVVRRAIMDAATEAQCSGAESGDLADRLHGTGLPELRTFLSALEERLVRELATARVVVTGQHWVGGGYGAVDSAIVELIGRAEREVAMTVYSFGAETIRVLQSLSERLRSGVRVDMVVNDVPSQPPHAVARLSAMTAQFPHLSVKSMPPDADGACLHSKIMAVDRRWALIGSANISRGGLVVNHEMAVVLEGTVAEEIARRVEALAAKLP